MREKLKNEQSKKWVLFRENWIYVNNAFKKEYPVFIIKEMHALQIVVRFSVSRAFSKFIITLIHIFFAQFATETV